MYRRHYDDYNDGGAKLVDNDGIVYNIEYDEDDYFRGNGYYKSKKPKTDGIVKFEQWRKDLDSKYMDCMSDKDLAHFLMAVDESKLSGIWEYHKMTWWIVQQHK